MVLETILGHPLNHWKHLLLHIPNALHHRRPTNTFPPLGRMDVHVVQVLRGTALSAPNNYTRDA
jgi:hypothetical protein